jgi:hypothetical protein
MALAYRIWAYAEPKGWDCTAREIAEALGVSRETVGGICQRKGWTQRLRGYDSQGHRRRVMAPGLVGEAILSGDPIREITARFTAIAASSE